MSILPPPLPETSPRRRTHDLVYSILLGVLAFCQLLSALVIGLVCFLPGIHRESLWGLHLAFALQFFYGAFEAVVLVIRLITPKRGKWPTVALNICLLPLFPFGTVLGIYGLWKADKAESRGYQPFPLNVSMNQIH